MDQMLSKYQPVALSLFRFMTGLLLFQYGVAKILKFPVLPNFAEPSSLILTAGGIELVLGALLMVGLFSRIVAFILSGEMAFAYFIGTFSARLSSADQQRHRGDPVLLRLPLSCDRRAADPTASMR